MTLSGASRRGHFGRSQFYLSLKLVAAAQAGCALNPDTFKSQTSINIPLPRFSSGTPSSPSNPKSSWISSPSKNGSTPPQLIPPPAKMSSRVRNGSTLSKGSPSHLKSLTPSSSPEPGSSPRALADQGWQSFVDEKDEKWTNSEEGCRLIEGEDDEEEDASDGTDDEEGSLADVYIVTDEQKEYYVKQFLSLESNPQGKVSGSVAKNFFEKSQLTALDLSKIWHLSDVDKDGALNLEEFCIAMHLVCLRMKGVVLAATLPLCLRNIVFDKKTRQEELPPLIPLSPTTDDLPKKTTLDKPLIEYNGLETNSWTKFTDSPTPRNQPYFAGKHNSSHPIQPVVKVDLSASSSSNSLTAVPANFDFNASCIESDPKILHPIPVRLTPEAQIMLKSLTEDPTSR